jgi:hypothetical protein
VLLAVEHWRSYLQFREFVIVTDQKSLVHLNEQRLNTVWQQKVFTKLLGIDYRIVYKRGQKTKLLMHCHADPLDLLMSSVVIQSLCLNLGGCLRLCRVVLRTLMLKKY